MKKVEAEIKRLEKERAELRPKVAAQEPPTLRIPASGVRKIRGGEYNTFFKAFGSFDRQISVGDSPDLLEMEDEELDLPTAFHSQQILGRVKWRGIRDREELIETLNEVGGWGMDFRRLYPKWEYVYRIVESIGGVPVRNYVHMAKKPRTKRDARRGWRAM